MVMDDPTYPSSVKPTPIAMPSAKLCIASPTRTSTDVTCIPGVTVQKANECISMSKRNFIGSSQNSAHPLLDQMDSAFSNNAG